MNRKIIIGFVLLAVCIILLPMPGLKENDSGVVAESFLDKMLVDHTDQFAVNGEILLALIKDKKYDDIEKNYPEFKGEMVRQIKEVEKAHGALLSYAWQRTQTMGIQSKINNRNAVIAINFYNLTHEKGEYTAIITNCRYFDNKQIDILRVNFFDTLADSVDYDDIIQSIEASLEQ